MLKRILLVDDDPLYVELARDIIESEEVSVISAPNGVAALAMLEQESPQMIISDIDMPVMDGITFCGRLKERRDLRQIPFLFVTGSSREAVIERAEHLSGHPLVQKTNLVSELPSLLNRML
jgi:CheY-like chemotaxis protein